VLLPLKEVYRDLFRLEAFQGQRGARDGGDERQNP
jgi:hypothetical protein